MDSANFFTTCSRRLERKRQHDRLFATGLYRLPTEVLLNIIDRIDMLSFPALLIAIFHLMQYRGIAPVLPSTYLYKLLLRQPQCSLPSAPSSPATSESTVSSNVEPIASTAASEAPKCLVDLPGELRVAISRTLSSQEKACYVLAVCRMRKCDIESLTHLPVHDPRSSM